MQPRLFWASKFSDYLRMPCLAEKDGFALQYTVSKKTSYCVCRPAPWQRSLPGEITILFFDWIYVAASMVDGKGEVKTVQFDSR